MTKRKRSRRARSSPAGDLNVQRDADYNVQREVDYIMDRATRGDARIVSRGVLVFFSTSWGDAWMLDAEDGQAYCLMQEWKPRETPVRNETAERFFVEWDSEFAIEGGSFFTRSADGKVTAWPEFPAEDIRAAVGRALESRR